VASHWAQQVWRYKLFKYCPLYLHEIALQYGTIMLLLFTMLLIAAGTKTPDGSKRQKFSDESQQAQVWSQDKLYSPVHTHAFTHVCSPHPCRVAMQAVVSKSMVIPLTPYRCLQIHDAIH